MGDGAGAASLLGRAAAAAGTATAGTRHYLSRTPVAAVPDLVQEGDMGFLGRMAMKRELRRLQPFFRADERFIDTDVCELVAISEGNSQERMAGGEVALTFTNRAFYFRSTRGNSDVVRVPYERVVDVVGARGMVEVVTVLRSYLFREIGRPLGGDKSELLSTNVRRLENHRSVIDVAGGQVIAINRPMDEGKDPVWLLQASEGVDVGDPSVRSVIEHELAGPISRYGPLGLD